MHAHASAAWMRHLGREGRERCHDPSSFRAALHVAIHTTTVCCEAGDASTGAGLQELWCAPQVMFLKYQLPSEPSVYVDLLDDEDVSLMFDEVRSMPVHFMPVQCCCNPWNLPGALPPAHMALQKEHDSLAVPGLIAPVWVEA